MPRRARAEAPISAAVWLEALTHRGLVKVLASEYLRPGTGLELEDLCQAGIVGVCRALQEYDVARGGFRAFTRRLVREEFREAVRLSGVVTVPQHEYHRPLHRRRRRALGVPLAAGPAARPDRVDPVEWGEVAAALGRLPARERLVLRGRYGVPRRTAMQLGAVLGLTPQRVLQIESGAILRLRVLLGVGPWATGR